ncbi:hypothetical protein ACHAWF_007936, partial [Thalassiosira exigua]
SPAPPVAAAAASSSRPPALDPREEALSTSPSLFDYLSRLSPRTLRGIYALPPPRGPLSAAAILRSSRLTDLARQCALRLVACGGSFGVRSVVEGWIHRKGRADALLALRRLERMGMLMPTLGLAGRDGDDDGAADSLDLDGGDEDDGAERTRKLMAKDATLTPEFAEAMKSYLSTASSSPWPIITQDQIDEHKRSSSAAAGGAKDGGKEERPSRDPPSRSVLDEYARASWDSVLHFLVGSEDADRADGVSEPPEAMVLFLKRIGLMQEDPDCKGKDRSRAPLVITSRGYEFMLRDSDAQVWQFVLQYVNSMAGHEQKDQIRAEALSFLVCLGSCRVGEGFHYSVLGKGKSARQVMKDFGRFGLLFVCRVAGKTAFYPTRAAVSLVASNEKSGGASALLGPSAAATRSLEDSLAAPAPSKSHLALVVQTNFQVVAYTRSRLHASTLGLFCDVRSYRRLPNVIFFHITRDSVRGAFRLGVTADQILRFLSVHAHPMLRASGAPLVPGNVRDQILLWDQERRRVAMDEVRRWSLFFSARTGLFPGQILSIAGEAMHKRALGAGTRSRSFCGGCDMMWLQAPTLGGLLLAQARGRDIAGETHLLTNLTR